ncbi:MAG: Uma2 family endonuclease [Cyanobacteria bacterium P01_C01_bin.120]
MTPTLVQKPAEQRVLLHHISWQTFKTILLESGRDRRTRFAYWQGTLEIMSPLYRHENINRFIDDLIRTMTDELNLGMSKGGSTTFTREDAEAGAEPDSCYYIQSEPLVRGRETIDLNAGDPPPDLVIEIDISTNSLDKRRLYADLGVREFWRFTGTTLQFFVLQPSGAYQSVDQSPTFPWLPADKLTELLADRLSQGETQTLRQFRDWVQQQLRTL